jgi:tetratricopeptide (TPR) repeat protein
MSTENTQEALKPVDGEKEKQAASALESEKGKEQTMNLLAEAEEEYKSVRPVIRPHAFVVMPFGKKKGGDGSPYDFNTIYKTLIKPALEDAGFEPFRADEETASGDILTDMFQELLLADLVLCDLSIDNANAFYELGIRHAFRKRGVMHIQAGRAYMPFDIFNVRTLPYHVTPEGVPAPEFLKTDIAAISRMARDTWNSDRDAVHSPIFNLLSGLKEPESKSLRTPLATGFWREYNEWKDRVTIAQRQKRIGDILVLTEEIRNPLIKEEAIGEAGKALANMGRNELALNQYRKGLEVNPNNASFRREEALHLNRIGRVDEAIVKLEGLLNNFPEDSEANAYLGRIYKEMWVDSWMGIPDKAVRMQAAFDSYHWLIKSINIYLRGYRKDLNNYYPGVNAHTLSCIVVHLAEKFDDKKNPDPDIDNIRTILPDLRGTLIFSLETKSENYSADYWTLISLAELRVLTADNPASVVRAYRKAITASRRNLFFLQSSLAQLEILQKLEMRDEYVKAGIQTLTKEIARVNKDAADGDKPGKTAAAKPQGQAFLFEGYMVDYPTKKYKAFPKEKEAHVRAEISKRLDKFNANENDRAFTAGLSAGSEIIFAELCVERGMRVDAHFALPDAAYVREFVSPGGDEWVERFYRIRNHPLVDEYYQHENLGQPKYNDDPYERNNRWALYASLRRGIDKVRLITLWDGKGGKHLDQDARLVKHMVDLMREIGGQIEQINSAKLSTAHYKDLSSNGAPAATSAARKPKAAKPPRSKK